MNRRRALAVLGTVGLTGVAGCLGEEMEYAADPAVIPDATAQGYEEDGPEEIEFDETIEAAGIEQDVHIRTWTASYADPDDETVVFLASTPDVSVAGVSVNPLARLSGADLIARVLDQGLGSADAEGGIQDIESEGEHELTVLDEERTLQEFSAVFEAEDAEQAGENGEIPITLYVLSFSHEEDVILSVGFHPDMEQLADEMDDDSLEGVDSDLVDGAEDETDETGEEIRSLMEAIEHPAETE